MFWPCWFQLHCFDCDSVWLFVGFDLLQSLMMLYVIGDSFQLLDVCSLGNEFCTIGRWYISCVMIIGSVASNFPFFFDCENSSCTLSWTFRERYLKKNKKKVVENDTFGGGGHQKKLKHQKLKKDWNSKKYSDAIFQDVTTPTPPLIIHPSTHHTPIPLFIQEKNCAEAQCPYVKLSFFQILFTPYLQLYL